MFYKIKSVLYFACLLLTSIIYYNIDKEATPVTFSDRTEITKTVLTVISQEK